MVDSDEKKSQAPLVPSWQQAASDQPDDDAGPSTENTLDQARRFLQEDTVKSSSREKKTEFLKAKGLKESGINKLLDEANEQTTTTTTTTTETTTTALGKGSEPPPSLHENKTEHPPIVTYPEFLTKPRKPPPLITASGLLNSLATIAGVSTLVYGATKHIVSPMVASLTQARVDFHEHANNNLTNLVNKLEQTVSELPPGYHLGGSARGKSHKLNADGVNGDDDNESSSSSSSSGSMYDDPTELFHRDVGVQTSAPPSPQARTPPPPPPFSNSLTATAAAANSPRTPAEQTQHQADRLARLSVGVRGLALDVVHQVEDMEATKSVLDVFGSELHTLTYPPESFGVGSSYLYGASRAEPDDEIKRVKTSIRAMKGVLLSTRNFPASVR